MAEPSGNRYDSRATVDRIRRQRASGLLTWGSIAGCQQHNARRQEAVRRFFLPKLSPTAIVVDIGAGSFVSAFPLIEYLHSGGYYALEKHQPLIDVGLEYLRRNHPAVYQKLKVSQIARCDDWNIAQFGVRADVVIALSVVSHIDITDFVNCCKQVAAALKPSGRFYFTFSQDGAAGCRARTYSELRAAWEASATHAMRMTYIGRWSSVRCPLGEQMMVRMNPHMDAHLREAVSREAAQERG